MYIFRTIHTTPQGVNSKYVSRETITERMVKIMLWYLVNVVWYDGTEAYVTEFVLPVNDKYELETSTKNKVKQYLDGNGEVLKFDIRYNVGLDNIVAYANDTDKNCVYNRFKEMYFTK